jgi:sulfur carrier protein
MPGPITVGALLQRLELNPESVLVIVGDELVTRDARLEDAANVEIRPVISGGASVSTEGSSPSERTPASPVSRLAESERDRVEIRPVISGRARP